MKSVGSKTGSLADIVNKDVKGEQVRKDITEGEAGLKMTLAIQVVDYKTCEVVPNAYVDIWSSNSTVSRLEGAGGPTREVNA